MKNYTSSLENVLFVFRQRFPMQLGVVLVFVLFFFLKSVVFFVICTSHHIITDTYVQTLPLLTLRGVSEKGWGRVEEVDSAIFLGPGPKAGYG